MSDYATASADEHLRAQLHAAVAEVGAEEGSVLLLTQDGLELEFVLSESPVAGKLRGLRQPLSKGITGLSFSLQQPMVVNDVARDAAFDPAVQERVQVCTRSIMVVPLVSPTGELGALTAINSRHPEGFSSQDLDHYCEAARHITDRLLLLNLTLPSLNDAPFE
jgi:GAF domain-containing protein